MTVAKWGTDVSMSSQVASVDKIRTSSCKRQARAGLTTPTFMHWGKTSGALQRLAIGSRVPRTEP